MASRNICLLVTNANGLINKLGELQHTLKTLDVDIAVVTETKFDDDISPSDVAIPGYHSPIRKDRNGHGGGVAVWVKHNLAVRHLDSISSDPHEVLWMAVGSNPQSRIVLGAVYRPGSCSRSDTSLIEYLDTTLDTVRPHGSHLVLAGDFNVHHSSWLSSSATSTAGLALEEVCASNHLEQHVTGATRGANILDLVLSDLPGPVPCAIHSPLGRSDHAVVTCTLALGLGNEPPSTRKVWRYNKADWHRLRSYYKKSDWPSMIKPGDDANAVCECISNHIISGMDKFIPAKTFRVRSSDPRWWTPECLDAVTAKARAWRKWRRDINNGFLRAKFIHYVSLAANTLARAKHEWEKRIKSKLTAGSLRDKAWWSTLKSAAGEQRSSDIPTLIDEQHHEYTSSRSKADRLAEFFSAKCSLGDRDLTDQDLPDQASSKPAVSSFANVHFRVATVKRHLSRLDVSKATGPDGIPARVLKECAVELAAPLSSLFSLCFRTGIQPTMWKIAHVVPVHKKASRSTIKNYRPVSLLSICSKVMEDIVNHQLVNYLEKYQLLSNRQFGFRRGLGTADLLTALQHQWVCTVGEGGCVQVLAVDIAGAFDKVSHPGLLWKLQRAGVQGKALRWLHDYLNQRRLKVVVGGKCSQPHFIKAGVPQGSILGPTLFLMYVNDAETCLSPGTQMAVYADDTTLYSLVRSTDTIQQQATSLQESLDALHAWGLKWRVSFEPSKSQYLSVSNRIDPWPHPCPTFGGTSVSREKSLKLLGVTFDSRLSFSEHLRQVSLRANSRLGFLRKASKYLDTAGKLATYRGFIRPLLEYAHLAWIGAAKSHLQQLDRVQRRALHILGPGIVLQSLEARRMVGALTYLYKLMCPESPRMLTSLVPPLQPPPTCPRTRQDQELSQRHQHQLRNELPASAPNFLRRSFPFCAIAEWNSLQPSLLDRAPALKHMQSFKSNVHKLLRQREWVWATDSL